MKKIFIISVLFLTAMSAMSKDLSDYEKELNKLNEQIREEQAKVDENEALELDYVRMALFTLDAPYNENSVNKALSDFRNIRCSRFRKDYAEIENMLACYKQYNEEFVDLLHSLQDLYNSDEDVTLTPPKKNSVTAADVLKSARGSGKWAAARKILEDFPYYREGYLQRDNKLSLRYLDTVLELTMQMVDNSKKSQKDPDFRVLMDLLTVCE